MDAKDCNGFTAVHLAAANGQLEVLRALKEFGFDMDAKDCDDSTAVHVAAEPSRPIPAQPAQPATTGWVGGVPRRVKQFRSPEGAEEQRGQMKGR